MNTAKLKAAAEKATPGRVGDRIDGSGSIKYRCVGADGSLVLLTDHKNNEYGFVGDNGEADELFFRLCTPEAVLELIAALEAAEKRIAELEARKLRVKMPALRNAEIMSDLAWNSAIDHCFDALIKATDDAGINLEIRGEA
ncbi:hypothetical protein AGJ37_01320 [Cronobacter sakazakii]|nr:hypothetical protein AGJ37_01320 [Cronobacter sakazakii]